VTIWGCGGAGKARGSGLPRRCVIMGPCDLCAGAMQIAILKAIQALKPALYEEPDII
jgi:hypothetical protein